jgi:hypothetical protein
MLRRFCPLPRIDLLLTLQRDLLISFEYGNG